jgi:hypothetical protein
MPYRVLSIEDLAHEFAQTDNQVKRDMQDALTRIETVGMVEMELGHESPVTGWQLIEVVDQFRKPLEGEPAGVVIGPLFIFFRLATTIGSD